MLTSLLPADKNLHRLLGVWRHYPGCHAENHCIRENRGAWCILRGVKHQGAVVENLTVGGLCGGWGKPNVPYEEPPAS